MIDLENITLILVHDEAMGKRHWLKRWEVSYPSCISLTVNEHESYSVWQEKFQSAFEDTNGSDVVVVAHSCGCNAFVAWIFQAGYVEQKRIRSAILATPLAQAWSDNPSSILNRARANCRTAIVATPNDTQCPSAWAKHIANQLGAKYLTTPYQGHLEGSLSGWQWGMTLMQDMLLN